MTMYTAHSLNEIHMPIQVSKSQFEPKSLEYFRQVQETGEPIIVTDHGKPVLKIVPYIASPDDVLQALRGSVVKYEDPLEPVGLEDWEALQ